MTLQSLKDRAKEFKSEIHALYFACRDPRTPWYAKAVGFCVIGYALSPIDLIPDPIPVIGYLDDLILLPLGILLFRRLVPGVVLEDCRRRALEAAEKRSPPNWIAAGLIVFTWCGLIAAAGWWYRNRAQR